MTKMLFRHLTVFLFLMMSLPVTAQKETEAKDILEKTSNLFKRTTGIEANFTLTSQQQGMPPQKNDGYIRLSGQKFRLEISGMTIWFNGETLWTYIPENEEVNVSTPTSEELQSINPLHFLTIYQKGYHCQTGEKKSFQGKKTEEIILKAEDTNLQWNNLTLYIDRTTYFPLYITLEDVEKNSHVITINNYRQSMEWKNSEFSFDSKQYPGVEVIDLR